MVRNKVNERFQRGADQVSEGQLASTSLEHEEWNLGANLSGIFEGIPDLRL